MRIQTVEGRGTLPPDWVKGLRLPGSALSTTHHHHRKQAPTATDTMPVRASPRTGRLKPMLRVPPPPRAESPNGGTPSPGPSGSAKGKDKAKGKGPERRVLPARVRRAAGGGAEGIRDIEEMVVDWLERWGE